MPSVLLETGYLTSKKDEEFLSNEQGQNYIASAIVNALFDFKNQGVIDPSLQVRLQQYP